MTILSSFWKGLFIYTVVSFLVVFFITATPLDYGLMKVFIWMGFSHTPEDMPLFDTLSFLDKTLISVSLVVVELLSMVSKSGMKKASA